MKEALVLGGGTYRDGSDDNWHLTDTSLARVRRTAILLAEHPATGVVISGGYSGASRGEVLEHDRPSEAKLMADDLTRAGFGRNIVGLEEESYSTVTNFTNSIRRGLIVPSDERPIGVVTHPHHMNRAQDVAKLLRIPIDRYDTTERDDAATERRLRALYKAAFIGIAFDSDVASRAKKMENRERLLLNTLLGRNVHPIE